MNFKIALALAFLTALAVISFKFFANPDSALVGLTILCYGWVSVRILEEGLIAIVWLIFRSFLERYSEEKDQKKNPPDSQ
jgi:hypothetical protein